MGILAGVAAMFSWGTAIFLAASTSRKIGNVLTLFWMQFFGFVIALLYFLLNTSGLKLSSAFSHLPIFIAISVLQVIAYLSFYKGLEKGEVSLVGPVGATWGMITAFLGVVFFKEVLTSLQLLAVFLILVGIVTLSIDFKAFRESKELKVLVGVKEGLIAMLGWGVSLFLLVIPSKDLGWFLPAFVFRFFVLAILVAYVFFTKIKFVPNKNQFPLRTLLLIGLFDIGGFFSYSFGVSGTNASIVAPIGSSFALVSVLLARIFLREKIGPVKAVGIFGIVLGLILISL